jgi:hypothetical protein
LIKNAVFDVIRKVLCDNLIYESVKSSIQMHFEKQCLNRTENIPNQREKTIIVILIIAKISLVLCAFDIRCGKIRGVLLLRDGSSSGAPRRGLGDPRR